MPRPQFRLRSLFILTALAAAAIALGLRAWEWMQDALTAEEILARVARTYAEAQSYRDTGLVRTVFISDDRPDRTVEKSFKTAFIRPDDFRFEYDEKEDDGRDYRYIIWRKGKEIQTWWDVTPGVE